MKYVAAYLLAVLGGNEAPTDADIGKILAAADVEADSAEVDRVLKAVDGKDLNQVITDGMEKLVNVGGGGGPAAAAAGDAPAAAVVEEEEEEEEEESVGGAADMFGGSESSSS